ncbi:MAG: 4-(cytidine 5'-diphospho)-2-C-methyl-D-erythritol kinase [Actinomycetota bacterium]|nr:MAG: 4-(cytidine 5'-diphospho)-2-C-methyl-D-erythritol kinase [Actinomycetota bacterium]
MESVFSPAKLTKYLKVTGNRADGMHEIESEMVTLSFGDSIELSDGDGIEIVDAIGGLAQLEAGLKEIPTDGSNLISKALAMTGHKAFVRVHKRIPPGAGLGGGSSNAAAILRYFDGPRLMDRALSLGADVSFCVRGGSAIVRGVGELLQPLPVRPENFVLLLSPFGVSTRDVYMKFDELNRDEKEATNQLESAAQACEPRLAISKKVLRKFSGVEPILAGSGSTYFIQGTFANLNLHAEPMNGEGFRYLDAVIDKTSYRFIETSTLPEFS